MSNQLGAKIKILRKQKGYTLEKLAELTASSKSYIWELENKKEIPRPSFEKLSVISEKLGVTIGFFSDDEATTPTEQILDEAFYREFQKMPSETKDRFRKLIQVWNEDD